MYSLMYMKQLDLPTRKNDKAILFIFIFIRSGLYICNVTFYRISDIYVRRIRWDVKWCPVSGITTPLARKRPFYWISMRVGS